MPEVAAGRSRWSPDQHRHLGRCADCAAEWALVQRAAVLGADVAARVDAEALASGVRRRLATLPRERVRRRWLVGGLIAAAALAALAVGSTLTLGSGSSQPASGGFSLLAPELDSLDTSELMIVLDSFEPTVDGPDLIGVPAITDLETRELEQVLQDWEG